MSLKTVDDKKDLVEVRRIALKHLDRRAGHDGRDGVLINQLDLAVAAQQHTKIVKPSNNALKLDAIYQKNGQRRARLPDRV